MSFNLNLYNLILYHAVICPCNSCTASRFRTADLTSTSRTSRGVRALKLREGLSVKLPNCLNSHLFPPLFAIPSFLPPFLRSFLPFFLPLLPSFFFFLPFSLPFFLDFFCLFSLYYSFHPLLYNFLFHFIIRSFLSYLHFSSTINYYKKKRIYEDSKSIYRELQKYSNS